MNKPLMSNINPNGLQDCVCCDGGDFDYMDDPDDDPCELCDGKHQVHPFENLIFMAICCKLLK